MPQEREYEHWSWPLRHHGDIMVRLLHIACHPSLPLLWLRPRTYRYQQRYITARAVLGQERSLLTQDPHDTRIWTCFRILRGRKILKLHRAEAQCIITIPCSGPPQRVSFPSWGCSGTLWSVPLGRAWCRSQGWPGHTWMSPSPSDCCKEQGVGGMRFRPVTRSHITVYCTRKHTNVHFRKTAYSIDHYLLFK